MFALLLVGAKLPVEGSGMIIDSLGGSHGFGEVQVPRGDDTSFRIDLTSIFENGINWFGHRLAANAVFINQNGTLTFGAAFLDFPTLENADAARNMIAPFWGDVDTRLDGEAPESGAIHVDLDLTSDVATVTWFQVGVYRRNATDLNTFQLQLYDRGQGDIDIVFRYQRIDWTQGTAPEDAGARVGFSSEVTGWITPEGLPAFASLTNEAGNSGRSGLWIFELRDGMLVGGAHLDRRLEGTDGHDSLSGGPGRDTIIGFSGDDYLVGGETEDDLSDEIYGGDGDDSINGGYGNDVLRGDGGNDTILGAFGVDTIIGGSGDDILSGSAWSDVLFGGDGSDFLNGGFGHDRINGGTGEDRFFHIGLWDHGADWVQDYRAQEGDRLVFGDSTARGEQFQVNYAYTSGAGEASVSEVFVIFRPTGQIIWALVDGAGQNSINLQIGSEIIELMG
ncbi:nidogen-like domain-containing protein [Shimia sp. SDUM112013]|uniref:calcium-binding protein n=1 Tax=Shimia sp. SDUM112013 TaxID=3136160 RepID=UPI0032EE4FDF